MTRWVLAAMAAGVLLIALPAPAAPLPVTKRILTDKNAILEVNAAYPQTGDAKIDANLRETVARIAAGFRKEALSTHDPKEPPYTLDVSYTIARNDDRMFAVVFDDDWDFHGAHPNLEIVTANYLRAGSWRVYLPELFDGERALARISQLAIADLDRRLLGPNGYSDPDWIRRGADAHWDNFQAFVMGADALEIQFPPYQVAAYAFGPQVTRIPLARLKDLMRADPRAPVASFDCAKAQTPDERAICSDVALARLDRALAESFSSEMRNEVDKKKLAAIKSDQIAWLNRRAAACRTAAGPAKISCLTALYESRLDALDRE